MSKRDGTQSYARKMNREETAQAKDHELPPRTNPGHFWHLGRKKEASAGLLVIFWAAAPVGDKIL